MRMFISDIETLVWLLDRVGKKPEAVNYVYEAFEANWYHLAGYIFTWELYRQVMTV